MKLDKWLLRFAAIVIAPIIMVVGMNSARADHFKMACSSKEAYIYASNTLTGEVARAKGRPSPIKNLGACYPLKRGLIVSMTRDGRKFGCLKSKAWRGCRYMFLQFFKHALTYSNRGFRKLKGRGRYKYMGL